MKPEQPEFVYVWEFLVREEQLQTFCRIYGPAGEWVELFRRAEGYRRTELYRDVDNPRRFVTSDFWASKTARDAFRETFRKDFVELDERCEGVTEKERFLGDFYSVPT